EAGGIEAGGNDEGFFSCDAMLNSFRQSATKLACLCGSDEIYAREGAQAARALIAAGAPGYGTPPPARLETALKNAGASDFIFPDCNALAMLQAAHSFLAVGR